MISMRTILVAVISISAGTSFADDDAERNWCGKLLTPRSCGREVVRIERYLKARDAESFRTGQGFNTGNSLVGCSVNCARRHVGYAADDENPGEPCTYSAAAMQRFEKLHREIRQTRIIEVIRTKCSGGVRSPDMPKRTSLDPEAAVPIRVEVVPRRGLNRQEASRYVGISTTKFDQMIREGKMPEPFRIGSRTIWDLRKLDAAFDLLSGPEEEFDSFADWDPPPSPPGRQPWKPKVKANIDVVQARRDARPGSLARSVPSKEYPGHPNVYTADSLAERWSCSGDHVRKLIQKGKLQAMDRMGRLIRISPAAVIAFEEANAVVPDR